MTVALRSCVIGGLIGLCLAVAPAGLCGEFARPENLGAVSSRCRLDQQGIVRLREMETLVLQGKTDAAVAAMEQFLKDYEDTEWAPRAVLLVGRSLVEAKQYERASPLLERARAMWGGEARDEALMLRQRCDSGARGQKAQAEAARVRQHELAATDPRPGLSAEAEVKRQDARAALLLAGGAEVTRDKARAARLQSLQRIVRECPRSGYVPFAELALLLARWDQEQAGGAGMADPLTPAGKQLARELQPQLEALARKYPTSAVGVAAQASALSLDHLVGPPEAVLPKLAGLLDLPVPRPDPYPLAASCLHAEPPGEFGGSGVATDPASLAATVCYALFQRGCLQGDVALARRALAFMDAHISEPDLPPTNEVGPLLRAVAGEDEALREFLLLRADFAASRPFARSASEACDRALQLAAKYPGGKVAPAVLYWAITRTGRDGGPGGQAHSRRLEALLASQYPTAVETMALQVRRLTEEGRYDEAAACLKRLAPGPARTMDSGVGPWSYLETLLETAPRPLEQKRQEEQLTKEWLARYGAFVRAAGVDRATMRKLRDESSLARDLIRRLPDRGLEIVRAFLADRRDADYGPMGEALLTEAIRQRPDDPLADELRVRVGGRGSLLAIIARGPQTPQFAAAVERLSVGTGRPKEEHDVRADEAELGVLATQYAGTPASTMARALLVRSYLDAERPERAAQVARETLDGLPPDAPLRDRLIALLTGAQQQIAAKRAAAPRKLWEAASPSLRADGPWPRLTWLNDKWLAMGYTDAQDAPALACLEAATGKPVWEARVGEVSSLKLVDGRVVVSTIAASVACLDAATGHTLWQRELGLSRGGRVACSVAEQVVVAYWSQGLLCALDLTSGKPLWERDGLLAMGLAPLVDKSQVYVWRAPGVLEALRLSDGTAVWSFTPPARAVSPGDREAPRSAELHGLVLRAGRLVIGCSVPGAHMLAALDPASGKPLWTQPASDGKQWPRQPDIATDREFIAASESAAHGRDALTGSVLWSVPRGEGERLVLPTPPGDVVVLAGEKEAVLFSRELGAEIGRVRVPRVVAAQSVPGGLRLIAAGESRLCAWELNR